MIEIRAFKKRCRKLCWLISQGFIWFFGIISRLLLLVEVEQKVFASVWWCINPISVFFFFFFPMWWTQLEGSETFVFLLPYNLEQKRCACVVFITRLLPAWPSVQQPVFPSADVGWESLSKWPHVLVLVWNPLASTGCNEGTAPFFLFVCLSCGVAAAACIQIWRVCWGYRQNMFPELHMKAYRSVTQRAEGVFFCTLQVGLADIWLKNYISTFFIPNLIFLPAIFAHNAFKTHTQIKIRADLEPFGVEMWLLSLWNLSQNSENVSKCNRCPLIQFSIHWKTYNVVFAYYNLSNICSKKSFTIVWWP